MRTAMLRYAVGVGLGGMLALAAGTGFAHEKQGPVHPARWRSTAFSHRTVRMHTGSIASTRTAGQAVPGTPASSRLLKKSPDKLLRI